MHGTGATVYFAGVPAPTDEKYAHYVSTYYVRCMRINNSPPVAAYTGDWKRRVVGWAPVIAFIRPDVLRAAIESHSARCGSAA